MLNAYILISIKGSGWFSEMLFLMYIWDAGHGDVGTLWPVWLGDHIALAENLSAMTINSNFTTPISLNQGIIVKGGWY